MHQGAKMTRGDLIRKLFKSYKMHDDEEFEKAALQIIAEEQSKNNHLLAKSLIQILEGSNGINYSLESNARSFNLPKDKERHTTLVEIRNPDRIFSDIILDKNHTKTVEKILAEYRSSAILETHGLEPTNKILFCGPPGCGKTLCAEIISKELGLPMLYSRFDSIVSSYLGETAANLRKIFDFASTGRWVLMFDEFDAIGKARDDHNEHGELKRVVNSFLQMLDNFKSASLIIAATNHEQLLDPALWRRFHEIVYFPKPSSEQLKKTIALKFRNFPYSFDANEAIPKLKDMSYADIERISFDSIKTAIIENKEEVDSQLFKKAIDSHKVRLDIAKAAKKRKNNDIS